MAPISNSQVRFEAIRFGYDPYLPILSDVNFTLRAGQITALVGPSGAGKTTLANLLLRFCEPLSGRILIDGSEIRGLDVQALRGAIGYVEQDIRLFSGSLRENIAYGKPGATQEEIERAAETMNCMEFIQRFPGGLDTRIGAGGVQLSGGQRQRIALARAIIRDPRILILDEAVSSQDAHSESLVQDALKKASRGRTTLLITHHLPTASIADHILVLANGKIAEEGAFHELAERGNYFRKGSWRSGTGIAA